jgi:hypothetical protein
MHYERRLGVNVQPLGRVHAHPFPHHALLKHLQCVLLESHEIPTAGPKGPKCIKDCKKHLSCYCSRDKGEQRVPAQPWGISPVGFMKLISAPNMNTNTNRSRCCSSFTQPRINIIHVLHSLATKTMTGRRYWYQGTSENEGSTILRMSVQDGPDYYRTKHLYCARQNRTPSNHSRWPRLRTGRTLPDIRRCLQTR